MVPLGYLYKRVAPAPEPLRAAGVTEVCSLSGCISTEFADYVAAWRHNGHWLFDTPEAMAPIAAAAGVDLTDMTLFYYTAFPQQFDGDARVWRAFSPDPSLPTAVRPPATATLLGFDIVTYSAGAAPECSPLSCNGLAARLPVNRHCLFATTDAARIALEAGSFENSEPGPYRIVAVHRPG